MDIKHLLQAVGSNEEVESEISDVLPSTTNEELIMETRNGVEWRRPAKIDGDDHSILATDYLLLEARRAMLKQTSDMLKTSVMVKRTPDPEEDFRLQLYSTQQSVALLWMHIENSIARTQFSLTRQ